MIDHIITDSLRVELIINKNQISGEVCLQERRQTGSFYTPEDAANAMWLNIIHLNSINKTKNSLMEWVKNSHFIEPSSGTGIFVYTLIKLLGKYGLATSDVLPHIKFTAIDINKDACEFFERSVRQILPMNIGNHCISILNSDGVKFLKAIHDEEEKIQRIPVIVGNPPYVKITAHHDIRSVDPGFKVTDIYALFVYWAAKVAQKYNGSFGLIIPLSFVFSNHYESSRRALLNLCPELFLTHYDNIPDSIFSNGKPDSENTNKSNSQRVTYCCGKFGGGHKLKVRSSKLIAWSRSQRNNILTSIPQTFDVMPWGMKYIIPKPSAIKDKRLLSKKNAKIRIYDLVSKQGNYSVWVSTTARNYLSVGLDKFKSTGILELKFNTSEQAHMVFMLLVSRTFLDYWRCIGDGFHVTKSNILEFPVINAVMDEISEIEDLAKSCWKNRKAFTKQKSNAGHLVPSYDFTHSESVAKIDQLISEGL